MRVNCVAALDVDQMVCGEVVIAMVRNTTIVWINLHVIHHFAFAQVEFFSLATENFSAAWVLLGRGKDL